MSKYRAFWYRCGHLQQNTNCKLSDKLLIHYLNEEWKLIRLFIYENKLTRSLGSYTGEQNDNLLVDLVLAKLAKMEVPNTIVATEKHILEKFLHENKYSIISKPLRQYPVLQNSNNIFCASGAFKLKTEDINLIYKSFCPTLFQEYIEKLYEVRIFYLKGKCYSMAIFSQLDEKTKTDYRNYNREKPNRNVPYNLPKDIEDKIRLFMDKSDLDTGSIDMIKSTDGRYVFLEVNPCGQFDWLSVNCNYYIEKKIAHYLAYGNTEFD